MPRRPRIARLEVNGIKIDVYDRETLLTLLEILGNDKLRRFNKEHKERKSNKEHKLHIADKADNAHKDDSFPESSEPPGGIPSYIEGNSWLKVLSRRG